MGRTDDEALDQIVVAGRHADAAPAAARLLPVGIEGGPLEVAVLRHRYDHVLVGDQILDRNLSHLLSDLGAALRAEFLLEIAEFPDDQLVQDLLRAQDLEVPGDLRLDFLQFIEDLLPLHARQALELEFDDRLGLAFREIERQRIRFDAGTQEAGVVDLDFAGQAALGLLGRRRGANQGDDFIDALQRLEEPQQDVLPVPRLAQQVIRAPADDVLTMGDEEIEIFEQPEFARAAIHDREQDHARPLLQVGVLVQVVQDDFRRLAALQFEHDPHAVAVALVPDVADALDLLLIDEIGGLLDEPRLVDLVRHLGDDDGVAVPAEGLDLGLRPQQDVAPPRLVGLQDAGGSAEDAASREVRSPDERQNPLETGVRVLDQLDRRVHQFGQIMRWDVCRHAHRDAVRAVDQQVRSGGRQVFRFRRGIVVVRPEVDRVHVDVFEEGLRVGGEPRLGVPHGRWGVAVDRAEIALAVDQELAHAEVLRHAHQRVVDRGVAVRMVLAHDLTHDAGALPRRAVRTQAFLPHGIEDAALDRLEPVADIGQRAADDHRHRVVEIRLAHLVLDIDRSNVGV